MKEQLFALLRLGYLNRLEGERFASEPIYQHHYA